MAKYVQPTFIVDSSASFLKNVGIDSSIFLKGSTFISSPVATTGTPYALVVDSIGDRILVKSIHLGTMALKQSADYDASISNLISKDATLDVSIAWLNTNLLHLSGGTLTGLLTLDDLGFTLDGQNIINIDTSADGLGGLDTHIPTSAAVKKAIDAGIASGITGNNGLIENPTGNFQLGGDLIKATTITTTNASTLTIAGLGSGTTRLAVISDGGVLKTQQLGDMSLETAANYYGKTAVDILLNPFATNASVGLIKLTLDASIQLLINADKTFATNASVGLAIALFATNASVGIAIAPFATNASVGIALGAYATNASIGTAGFENKIDVDTSFGLYSTTTQMNTQLGYRDTSISGIWTKLGLVDTKNAAQDTSLNSIWTNFGLYATNVSIGLAGFENKIDVDTSFGLYATNASIGLAGFAKNASLGLYVQKTGDTMTGPLSITAGGLTVTNDVSINGGLYVNTNATIKGNLIINGSLYVVGVEEIDVSAAYIHLNSGLTGTPPSNLQSGIIVNRGTSEPYVFLFDESYDEFRIGVATETSTGFLDSNTQAVLTREDNPTSFGIGFWDGTKYRIDTSAGFTFTPGVGLSLPIASVQASEMTALVWNGSLVGSRDLGTMAFETASNYYLKTAVNTLITDVSTQLDTRLDIVDISIAGLNALTIVHTAGILDLSTNAIRAVANVPNGGTASLYAYELNNIAYIKKLAQGAGITIVEDSSTVTIAIGGTTGVQKYKGTFNGTTGTSFVITAVTHGLGVGPLLVAVYESLDQVFTGVNCAANGDITLTWTAGSLTDTACKFIITG